MTAVEMIESESVTEEEKTVPRSWNGQLETPEFLFELFTHEDKDLVGGIYVTPIENNPAFYWSRGITERHEKLMNLHDAEGLRRLAEMCRKENLPYTLTLANGEDCAGRFWDVESYYECGCRGESRSRKDYVAYSRAIETCEKHPNSEEA